MSFNAEMWISLASAIVAICALGVTIWQGFQNRKHNKLSVRPFLSAKVYWDVKGNTGFFTYELMNCGAGPAIIKDFISFFGDKEVSRNNEQTYRESLNKKLSKFGEVIPVYYSPGVPMQTNEIQAILTFEYNIQEPPPINIIDFINKKINIVVNYQSIYQDETFTYDPRKLLNTNKL